MEWTQSHDLALCRELLVTNPFQEKYKTTKRAKLWDEAAANLAQTSAPPFKKSLDRRAVQERYRLLTEKFQKKMAKERRESGSNPTMTELDALVEELEEREHTERDRRDSEGKSSVCSELVFYKALSYSKNVIRSARNVNLKLLQLKNHVIFLQ